LSTIVEKEFHVIVGDAKGADKAFQTYLADMGYANVTVFCSGPECRNNIGEWNVKHISVGTKLKGRDFYTQKDKSMAGEADYGLVLWDGESPGSISNVIEMLKRNKRAVVYLSPGKQFYSVSHLDDANKLLEKYDRKVFEVISKKIRLSSSMKEIRNFEQGALSFWKGL